MKNEKPDQPAATASPPDAVPGCRGAAAQPCASSGQREGAAAVLAQYKPSPERDPDLTLVECEVASQSMATTQPSPAIKDYLRKIGSRGGKKSAQHPERTRLNREAAISRWRKKMPEPKEIKT